MKVIDLRIQLERLDPHMEVLMDFTSKNDKMFHLVGIAAVEEVGIENDKGREEQVLLLMPFKKQKFSSN